MKKTKAILKPLKKLSADFAELVNCDNSRKERIFALSIKTEK